MAIYHFSWDLEFFGYLDVGTIEHGGWRLFARAIATSFLMLVGVSLFLAHEREFHWRPFWRRLVMIIVAAAAITLATWLATPNAFIFFGILHSIAVASVLGLAFIALPAPVTLLAAVAVIALPHYFRSPFFDHPSLWWLGFSDIPPHSNDYVPIFPWFGAVLIGIGAARVARRSGLLARLAELQPGWWSRPLTFVGRHSLAFYLIHQPVLISLVWIFAQFWPAPAANPEENFARACTAQCTTSRDTAFCARYCQCALESVRKEGLMNDVFAPEPTARTRDRMNVIAEECTATTEFSGPATNGETNPSGDAQ